MTVGDLERSLGVSRETIDQIEKFVSDLERWNSRINLIAPSTIDQVWSRHVLDSAQLLSLAPKLALSWTDMGTGGGFPGLVVAILAKELRPELSVTCIESDKRKAAFLSSQARALDLKMDVLAERIETAPAQRSEIVSARALAPLERLLQFSKRHLAPGGVALFLKGRSYGSEVQEARRNWHFNLVAERSSTDPSSAILKVGDIKRV